MRTFSGIEDRRRQALNGLHKILTERGHKCRDSSDGRVNGLDMVDGYMTWFECVEEERKTGSITSTGNGRLRIKIGSIGEKQQFPEPKDGFDLIKIADAISQMVAWKKNGEASRLKLAEARAKNEPIAEKLNAEFGLSGYGRLGARVGSDGAIWVKFEDAVE